MNYVKSKEYVYTYLYRDHTKYTQCLSTHVGTDHSEEVLDERQLQGRGVFDLRALVGQQSAEALTVAQGADDVTHAAGLHTSIAQ